MSFFKNLFSNNQDQVLTQKAEISRLQETVDRQEQELEEARNAQPEVVNVPMGSTVLVQYRTKSYPYTRDQYNRFVESGMTFRDYVTDILEGDSEHIDSVRVNGSQHFGLDDLMPETMPETILLVQEAGEGN